MNNIQKKCVLFMDGSLFFRAILWFFDGLTKFFQGSLVVRLFTADFDTERLKHSFFVRNIEKILNFPPKFGDCSVSLKGVLGGSRIIKSTVGVLGFDLPAYILIAVVLLTPFLPTIPAVGLIAVAFFLALFFYTFKLELIDLPLMFFMVVSLISAIMSVAASYSIPIAFLSIAIMLSCILSKTAIFTRSRLDLCLAAFVVATLGTGFVAIFQMYTGYLNPAWIDAELFAGFMGVRVFSTFGNPNIYAAYLLLAIPIAAVCILYAKNTWFKLFAFGTTIVLLGALAATYSRGAYVALALSVMVFMLLIERRLIVLFVAGLAVAPFLLPATILARVLSIVNLTDSSTMYRIAIWQSSLRMIGDFWMAGIGQGAAAYNAIYPFYAFSAVVAQHTHNLFLQIFIETGLVGLLVFVAILACFFRTQFSFIRRAADVRLKLLSQAMVSAVVGFLALGMFDYPFHNYRVMLTFYLFLGIASCVVNIGSAEYEKNKGDADNH
ncbi:MAG: O-antigen ligase family protein [Turicibacter sp.]|nr:O-antigen ligase family protein [Turicibacter sp.]